jgi:hypothetical protein
MPKLRRRRHPTYFTENNNTTKDINEIVNVSEQCKIALSKRR